MWLQYAIVGFCVAGAVIYLVRTIRSWWATPRCSHCAGQDRAKTGRAGLVHTPLVQLKTGSRDTDSRVTVVQGAHSPVHRKTGSTGTQPPQASPNP